MKSYVAVSASATAKRKWKWFATAVLALVILSLLVPLTFLLGLHNRFPSGYLTDDRSPLESSNEGYDKVSTGHENDSPVPQGMESSVLDAGREPEAHRHHAIKENSLSNWQVKDGDHPEGIPNQEARSNPPDASNARKGNVEGTASKMAPISYLVDDETKKRCELVYGSYCLWSIKHKEKLKDFMVQRLKDQLFVARGYFPSIAKLKSQEIFSREVKQNIQDHERMLCEAIVDADLPSLFKRKMQKMDETITKAKSFKVECINVNKKLAQILDLTEDEARFHMKQGAFLYHLGVQTMPRSLHCLSMRLTVEYFRSSEDNMEKVHAEKLENPAFQHYVIFTKNILASSVTVNSTVMNSKVSENLVFHLLTDEQNYYATKLWFSRNSYKDAVIHVLNMENFGLRSPYNSNTLLMSFSEEFRIFLRDPDQLSSIHMRTEYISTFGHSHFLLPDIFKNLKKVVVLDDDIVVQQDLSPLWNLNMKGKVNGAVQFCNVRLGQLKHYFGTHNVDRESCTWMSGLNIVDLERWREHDISATYQMLREEVRSMKDPSWRAASLPISLLAFQDTTYALNDTWLLSGLGKDYGISKDSISKSAVLHYNGNMKPWLELGIPRYKSYWKRYLIRGDQYMAECNVNL